MWFRRVIDYAVSDLLYQAERANSISKVAEKAVEILDAVSGMTQCHDRDFKWSRPLFVLKDGTVVRSCTNVIGLDHIFLADSDGNLIYGGFVGWIHSDDLKQAIQKIKQELT